MDQPQSLLKVPKNNLYVDTSSPPAHNKDIDARWVQVKFSHSFTPRSYFASCIQAGNIYVHGGFSAELGIMKDMYTCCLYQMPAQWKLIQVKNQNTCSPGALRNHTINSYMSNLILVGGQKNVVDNSNGIYRYDLLGNAWTLCKCVDEKGKKFNFAIDSHSSVIYKNCLYIIGGYDAISTEYLRAVIKISLQKINEDLLTFEVINYDVNSPSPRGNAICCLAGNQIFMFGGGNVEDVFGDFWSFNMEEKKWNSLKQEDSIGWPERRKGGTLVLHEKSNTLFLFGGIKKITKEQNDVMVYVISRKRWIKIHSSTNQLYDPSPTLKELQQSPTVAQQKRKRERVKTSNGNQNLGLFKLGMKSVSQTDSLNRMHETNIDFLRREPSKSGPNQTLGDFKRKMSVVQQKKYRQFLNRKKKLLSNIESGFEQLPSNQRRSHSPTSEALIFSLNCMGEQPKNDHHDMTLPKVIYDQGKGQVIGKKPCARDGHAGLLHEQCMIILGGDRHMVSFNDAYLFKLNKGVQSLPHYE